MSLIEGLIYMLWRGLAIGVIISAPMGPVGILCVQRTLEKGRRTGFYTGVGAAISDLFYCLLTGFGLSLIEDFLTANQNIIQLIGSVVLVAFGVFLFKSTPARKLKKPEAAKSSRRKDVLQGFLFTFSNPLIIFLIIGLFARFNFLLPELNFLQYVVGYVFIITGALLWWWLVSFFVDKVRRHFNLRSMWLINKITGGIILIFAVVGLVTAISGLAGAATPTVKYMNSVRGFGPLADEKNAEAVPLTISCEGPDSVVKLIPLDFAGDFTFSFRVSDRHGKSGKSWKYLAADGSQRKVSNPGWGILAKSGEKELLLMLDVKKTDIDDIYAPTLHIKSLLNGRVVESADRSMELGVDDEWNSFRLRLMGDALYLQGGYNAYSPILELPTDGMTFDSIGFLVPPGGEIEVDFLALDRPAVSLLPGRGDFSHFANADVRESYYKRSSDPMEGVWEVFDRQLDDAALRPGGNYRLAAVKSATGYELVYLQGSRVNSGAWTPGATKARLAETAHRHVYELQWFDPTGRMLDGECVAQFEAPDMLTLRFVDHGSSMRLRRIKE